jgi:prevent-host-death family protein
MDFSATSSLGLKNQNSYPSKCMLCCTVQRTKALDMRPINLKDDVQPLSKFRSGVSSYIQQVTETKRPLLITQHGKGVALLTDVGEFENL